MIEKTKVAAQDPKKIDAILEKAKHHATLKHLDGAPQSGGEYVQSHVAMMAAMTTWTLWCFNAHYCRYCNHYHY